VSRFKKKDAKLLSIKFSAIPNRFILQSAKTIQKILKKQSYLKKIIGGFYLQNGGIKNGKQSKLIYKNTMNILL